MKAVLAKQYGPPDVFEVEHIEKPVPKGHEILVKVVAAGVTSGDARVRGLNVPTGFGLLTRLMFGFSAPRNPVLGMDFAGEVAAVGKDVTEFREGDQVFGSTETFGSYAEYLTVPADKSVVHKPENISLQQAAAVPFGTSASLVYLRDFGKIKQGQKLLVNGASGSLGTYAIQLGKHFGATVTGICGSSNAKLVRALGADEVIDYTQEDVTSSNQKYDIIFDTVGKLYFSDCKPIMTDEGRFLMAVAGIPQFAQVMWTSFASRKKAVAGVVISSQKDLKIIKHLIEEEKLKPIIDQTFRFDQMAEAHRYIETGHKKGNIIAIV